MIRSTRRIAGFTLIELMIAMTIGLLLLSGLAMIFVNSSEANREMQKTAQQIENGRYATDVISQDLRLAGFYGHLHDLAALTAPATIPPDPCEDSNTGVLLSALRFPVQGYRGTIHASDPASNAAASGLTTACAAILTSANLKAGSDVLVIRRADTNAIERPAGTTDADVLYIHASAINAKIQVGAGTAIGNDQGADGNTAEFFLNNLPSSNPGAPVRRLRVHIYFVAPCSVPSDGSTVCTGATDDGGRPIPTLKRLELTASGTFTIVPLVEGIEHFKVEYGIDDAPGTVTLATGLAGDANVDRFEIAPSGAEWESVIAAKIYLLARNTEPTVGFTDDKTYRLGSAAATDNVTVPAATGANARFKRHVYAAAVQVVNAAGRREIP
jgi:type IV pilus assembly protein PilW